MDSQAQPQERTYRLTTRNLFNHFLLVHDFLKKFTVSNSQNPSHLDAQSDVKQIMTNSTAYGGLAGQLFAFTGMAAYFLHGHSIPRKFLIGFLYVYWMNHFYTLGTYAGAFLRMPTAYRVVGAYLEKHDRQHPNILDQLEQAMEQNKQYEDTYEILAQIFPEVKEGSKDSYTTNDFFVKNKEKYIPKEFIKPESKKLPYLDSFITRYVYYSFTRWLWRVQLFVGLKAE